MLKPEDILDEVDKRLYKISEEVKFPLPKEDKKKIKEMLDYLKKVKLKKLLKNLI